jgi:transcriptional regulator with XRE-family HTH domain
MPDELKPGDIGRLCHRLNLTKRRLAKKMNYSEDQVTLVDKGRQNPTGEFLTAYADAVDFYTWATELRQTKKERAGQKAETPTPEQLRIRRLRASLDYILEFGKEENIRAVDQNLDYVERHVRSDQHQRGEETSEPQASG